MRELLGLRKEGKRLVPDDGDADQLLSREDSGNDEFWVRVRAGAELGAVKVETSNFKGVGAAEAINFEVLAR